MSESPESTALAYRPPPWTCTADFYLIPFYTTASTLPLLTASFLHAPLEAAHEPSLADLSRPLGGLGMLQIVRYKDTPVGPYDEMLVIPGSYAYAHAKDGNKEKVIKGKALRITRIYVSQRETCYNGRKIWNIPKHLATFDFTTNPDSSLTLSLRPHPSDSSAAAKHPFFKTTFRPTPYLPPFPLSLTALSPLLKTLVVQPPLPEDSNPEVKDMICGTDRWCAFSPKVKSWRTRVGWFDMQQQQQQQHDDDVEDEDSQAAEGAEAADEENFWPGWGRWRFGIFMKDAEMFFEEPGTWSVKDARPVKP